MTTQTITTDRERRYVAVSGKAIAAFLENMGTEFLPKGPAEIRIQVRDGGVSMQVLDIGASDSATTNNDLTPGK